MVDRGLPGVDRDPRIGDPAALVGRAHDAARVRQLIDGGSRTAVVLGIPGVGKTSLLDVVARSMVTEGRQVLRLRGRVTEQSLGFACLLDLLAATTTGEPDLLGAAEAIREQVAPRGESTSRPGDALRLRLDTVAWLERLSRDAPVLVVVDDAQWLDPSSRSVISFVANRVSGSRVSFLFSWRADEVPDELADHPAVALRPLQLDQALALLQRSYPALAPVVRNSVVQRAAGNPLALLELARAAESAAASGGRADEQSVPASVEAAFAAEVPTLNRRTRHLLLLAAAGADDLHLLGRLLGTRALARDLEPAERLGLVRAGDRTLRFRHPLLRATVYDAASTSERLAAHGQIADAYDDGDRRTWHRAAATLGPDEELAVALSDSAARSRRRGAHAEAADAMLRAAELSTSTPAREERLLEALSLTGSTGEFGRQALLSQQLRSESADPRVRAIAGHHHAFALALSMKQSAAQETLEQSLTELLELDQQAGLASLTTLASLVYQTRQNVARTRLWLERYENSAPDAPPDPLAPAARAWVRVALDPNARPPELVSLVREAPASDAEGESSLPVQLRAPEEMLLGATAWLLNEHDVALRRLVRAVDLMRGGAGVNNLIQTVMALGQAQFDTGLYAEADGSGQLMIDIAEAETLPYYRSVGRELRARVAAVRGDAGWARHTATDVLLSLEVGECVALEANLRVALFVERFRARDYAAGYDQLRALFDRNGVPIHPHVAYRALGDLASVAMRSGHVAAVRPIVQLAEQHLGDALDMGDPRLTMILRRAQALVSDEDAETLFQQAVQDPAGRRWPLEWANTHLDYGLWLRRHHRAAAARPILRTAKEVFERLGASAWAAVADAELRASGVVGPDVPTTGWADLTAQEREVVELAATGLRNREIAAALYLSPRTVSAHLYRAFPKLGVTARSQLRDAIARRPDA
ncbi:LuxR family transcriptional regulator [soil metagenome]